MENQKLENLLNLSLSVSEAEREKSSQLSTGFLTDSRKISFDTVVTAMYETGKDLLENYRETANGGLAKLYNSS